MQEAEIAYIVKEDVPDEALRASEGPALSPVLEAIFSGRQSESAPADKKKEEEFKKQVNDLVNLLKSPDESVREQALAQLRDIGKRALPVLADRLTDTDHAIRFQVSKLFLDMKPKEAIKAMIEAMYAASPEQGGAPQYLEYYLRHIQLALRDATGVSAAYNPLAATQAGVVQQYVDWYNENWDKLPPQVTDPPLDKDDPDYQTKFKEARALKLTRRTLRPPSFAGAEGAAQ